MAGGSSQALRLCPWLRYWAGFRLAPYHVAGRKMLQLAAGNANDRVVDLGCDDARLLVAAGHDVGQYEAWMLPGRPDNRRIQGMFSSGSTSKGSSVILPYSARGLNTQAALLARQRSVHEEESQRDLTRQEDPFDTITDKIPEKPVTVAEGASYSVVILLGLAVAGAAAYAVFKELVFEPKEYKVFGKALSRVQTDNQVSVRLGSPITGYGQESRNRAARQRISNRAWTDEAGVERIEVMFHIRGPAGAGKVYSEMFKDPEDRAWKYTYLIVDITSPSPTRLMLESYVPPLAPLNPL